MVGEHIRILKGGRWIHAVDCGDETVLHLAEEAPPPRVRRAYRPEFVAGAASVEVVTHRERTFPAKEIVKRAYSRASDPALAAMFRDSEAFAEWCTTGRLAGARNYAVEIPGVAPAPDTAPRGSTPRAAPAPAKAASPARKPAKAARAAGTKVARSAPRKQKAAAKARASAKPATRKTAPRRKVKAARAKPTRKVAAKRGAKPARKARR